MGPQPLDPSEAAHVVYGWQPQDDRPKVCFTRGERIYLWDRDSRRYMDFGAGQINVNVGYSHPYVLEALSRQMREVAYVAPNFATQARSHLASMLAARTPPGLDYVFFTSSGSESIEVALKIARSVTGRHKIYSAWRSYHGATAGAAAVSGDPRRLFVEPAAAGIAKFHGASCHHCAFGHRSAVGCGLTCLEALRQTVILEGPETIAAIVLEPIVGTSGLFIPPVEFIVGVASLCREQGILLIFDETMTGWGRTGKWFACEHFGVWPDILVTAKGITSAYVPLGATVMTRRIRDHFLQRPFIAGSTNEGHALGCAAGIANMEIYEREGLMDRSRTHGLYLLECLTEIQARHPCVGDVRGKGLFACLELTADRERRTPLAGYRDCLRNVTRHLTDTLLESGLIVIAKWDFVMVAPPLVIEKSELDDGLQRLDDALYDLDAMLDARSARPALVTSGWEAEAKADNAAAHDMQ
jgi:adenosylmethionine-8-amino-7-oxononanoate aminotransferase